MSEYISTYAVSRNLLENSILKTFKDHNRPTLNTTNPSLKISLLLIPIKRKAKALLIKMLQKKVSNLLHLNLIIQLTIKNLSKISSLKNLDSMRKQRWMLTNQLT